MPSFFKTVVISALVACPTVFVTASAADDKKDENKKDTKKDKKTDSSIEGLDTVIAKRYPKLDKALIEKLRALYQAHVHKAAAFGHFMVTDELTVGGVEAAHGLSLLRKAKDESTSSLADAYTKIAQFDPRFSFDGFLEMMLQGAILQGSVHIDTSLGADAGLVAPRAVVKNHLNTPYTEQYRLECNLTDSGEVKKFDEGVKPKLVRLVAALRKAIEAGTECALGLCDKKAIETMEKEDKAEADKAKEEAEKAKKGSSDKTKNKEDDKPTADKVLKKFEEGVVEAEKEAKKLFAATRIGSLEKKIKDQKDSNRSLALGLGLGLGLGLPFVFGIGIFAAMKAGCLQYNPVA